MRKIFWMIAVMMFSAAFAQVDKTDWPEKITLATVPTETTEDATVRFKPLADYLAERLGIEVDYINGADYAAVTIAMQSKQVDIGFYGPGSYLDARDQAGAEAFVKENSIESGTGYYSLIISKKDSPIKTVEDMKDQEFAFVDPGSTSGFRVPMYSMCTILNIDPTTYFKRTTFAGTHENVILGVSNGTIAVGATNDLSIKSATDKGQIKGLEEDFNVVYKSDQIPASPVAMRGDLPETLKAEIKQAFLEFDDKEFFERIGLAGWVEATPEEYEAFRTINAYNEIACQ